MPSRISGACNGCRSKKQKCSGDRTGCAQCLATGIPCTWPEQRKRGPAKGYIEALEQRLYSAESLLLAILPRVDDSILQQATELEAAHTFRAGSETSTADVDEKRANRSSPPPLNKKTGIEYWENFPLDSASHIRRWQQDCEAHSSAQLAADRGRAHSQSKMSSAFPPLRADDDLRSSATAAATIASMRHSASSPGTPGSNSTSSIMAVSTGTRPVYESTMNTGRSMSLSQASMTPGLTQHVSRQQPPPPAPHHHPAPSSHHQPSAPMWYQPYAPQAAPGPSGIGVPMNMNVDHAFSQEWSQAPGGSAMDVDTTNMSGGVHPASRQTQHGSGPGGLYQGDFSQNIFW